MAEVLKYRHIKGITLFNAFVTLSIDGEAWHQRVGTNLFQILQGFMVLFIKKTNLPFTDFTYDLSFIFVKVLEIP